MVIREEMGKIQRCAVLVVDDHASIRELIVLFLSRQGYECTTARNGMEALNKFSQSKYGAVVVDLAMPEMDGMTLTRRLLDLYPKLPIMAMTAYIKEYSVESILKAGIRGFIWKPFRIDEFLLQFNRMMGTSESLC